MAKAKIQISGLPKTLRRRKALSAADGASPLFLLSVPGSSGSPTEVGVSRSEMNSPIAPANEMPAGIQKHQRHAPTWASPVPMWLMM